MNKTNNSQLSLSLRSTMPLLALAATLGAAPVVAQTDEDSFAADLADSVSIGLFVEADYDDNIRKAEANEKADLKQIIGVNFGANYTTRSIDLATQYSLTHEEYQHDSYDGKTRLEGYLSALFSSNPERYSWVFKHQQSIGLISSQDVSTTDNIDQRSTFTTGPDVKLRITPVDMLTVSGRYIDTRFDESENNDTQRGQVQLNWGHSLSQFTHIGLNASHTEVDAEEDGKGYEQQRLGVSFSSQFRYGQYSIEVGGSNLTRDDANIDDVNGVYGNFNYTTSWAGQSFGASVNRDITDSSVGLSLYIDPESDFQNGDNNFNSFDVITRTRYQVFYRRTSPDGRLGGSITLAHDIEDYSTELQDQENSSVRMGLDYQLTQNINAFIDLSLEQADFTDQDFLGEDQDVDVAIGINHNIRPNWDFRYVVSYEQRDNSDVASREYQSLGGYIRISYQFR
ncbi:MAG: hypothetical protein WCY88_10845 [Spongiibacteraceae bacterium]